MMQLYFIAVEPPAKISEKVREVSKDFAQRFSSEKAYKNFPHITLIPPFKMHEEKEPVLVTNFSSIKLEVENFTLHLNGFGSFAGKKHPVIFIRPENREPLQKIFDELSLFFDFSAKNFNPHLTVAYRDLSLENFEKAWPEYKDKAFTESFDVKHIGLYKFLNNKWSRIASLSLA